MVGIAYFGTREVEENDDGTFSVVCNFACGEQTDSGGPAYWEYGKDIGYFMFFESNPVMAPTVAFYEAWRDDSWGAYAAGLAVDVALMRVGVTPGSRRAAAGVGRWGGRGVDWLRRLYRGGCFAAGTLIVTEHGLRPIEEVELGDLVWARDDETGEDGWKPVTKVFVIPDHELLELSFEAEDGTEQVLRVTPEHPLWSLDDRAWDGAGHLELGEEVDALGGPMRLVAAVASPMVETVYNFEVAESHTYFVGAAGVWAHNSCVDAARKIIAKLPGNLFKPLECTSCASGIVEALKGKGLKGQILNIRAGRGDYIVNDLVEAGANSSITENGFHQAVRIGDTVFDNYFRRGVPYDAFVKALHARGGISISTVSF